MVRPLHLLLLVPSTWASLSRSTQRYRVGTTQYLDLSEHSSPRSASQMSLPAPMPPLSRLVFHLGLLHRISPTCCLRAWLVGLPSTASSLESNRAHWWMSHVQWGQRRLWHLSTGGSKTSWAACTSLDQLCPRFSPCSRGFRVCSYTER